MNLGSAVALASIVIGMTPLSAQVPATGAAAPASPYPPCSAGAGDDRCIQLYEPGVRRKLARAPAAEDMSGAAGSRGERDPSGEPVGTTINDPVDTQGGGIIGDNARGIDADAADPDGAPN